MYADVTLLPLYTEERWCGQNGFRQNCSCERDIPYRPYHMKQNIVENEALFYKFVTGTIEGSENKNKPPE